MDACRNGFRGTTDLGTKLAHLGHAPTAPSSPSCTLGHPSHALDRSDLIHGGLTLALALVALGVL